MERGRVGEATGDGVKRGRGGEEEGVEGVDMREGVPTDGGEVEGGWYLHMLLGKSLLAEANLSTWFCFLSISFFFFSGFASFLAA